MGANARIVCSRRRRTPEFRASIGAHLAAARFQCCQRPDALRAMPHIHGEPEVRRCGYRSKVRVKAADESNQGTDHEQFALTDLSTRQASIASFGTPHGNQSAERTRIAIVA
jgi:hypothetical protein